MINTLHYSRLYASYNEIKKKILYFFGRNLFLYFYFLNFFKDKNNIYNLEILNYFFSSNHIFVSLICWIFFSISSYSASLPSGFLQYISIILSVYSRIFFTYAHAVKFSYFKNDLIRLSHLLSPFFICTKLGSLYFISGTSFAKSFIDFSFLLSEFQL